MEAVMNISIRSLLSERVAQENAITDVEVTETTIMVSLSPKTELKYERPDCQNAFWPWSSFGPQGGRFRIDKLNPRG